VESPSLGEATIGVADDSNDDDDNGAAGVVAGVDDTGAVLAGVVFRDLPRRR